MIWINYPNNPTGATAPPEFFNKLIAWAKAHDVAVVSDNAYSEVYFDNHHRLASWSFPGQGGGNRDSLPFQVLQLLRMARRDGGG